MNTLEIESWISLWTQRRERERKSLLSAVRTHLSNGGAIREWLGEKWKVWSLAEAVHEARWCEHPTGGGAWVGNRTFIPECYNPDYLANHLVARLGLGTQIEFLGM
jgi:hypothetical protein